MELYDLFLQGLQDVVMLYHAGNISFERIGIGTFYDDLAIGDEQWVYPGIVKDDLYYFMIWDGSKCYLQRICTPHSRLIFIQHYDNVYPYIIKSR